MLNIRGQKLFPSVIEEVVRGFDLLADEFQIVLEKEGVMDTFTIVAETRDQMAAGQGERLSEMIAAEVIRQCELRPRIRLVTPGTLPKTEFKARRVIDRRRTL